ncbi:acyl-phosphate glycerol 3-phosphate acyltransferase [Zobellella endophytica]|uniref:Acyl-phosphate glycerol 3-phosphate acyltransferase n=1 Tax=Zobellella endophytica TaxID=2116700 RepID=A0A2P7RCG3_9GAMM|nr:AMP-binding protein [Zobellella endophytica]PSJ47852.1 acyl-phosphate glycerol 3-phosphate acyltransferase [Zobellella endophytica]
MPPHLDPHPASGVIHRNQGDPVQDEDNSPRQDGPHAQRLLELVDQTLRDLQPDAPAMPPARLDSTLDQDLALDSLSRMELLLRIEQAFALDLPEDTLQRADTVRDLLLAIEQAPRAAARGRPKQATAPGPTPPDDDDKALTTASTLLEVLDWHERAHPQRVQSILVTDESDQPLSYGELAAGSRRVAAALQQAGVAPGQAVAIMLPTSLAYFHCYFGILLMGAIPVPIYPPARASQLEDHVLRHAGILANAAAVLLITVPEAKVVARLLQARVPGLRRLATPEQMVAPAESLLPVEIRGEDTAFIQYTSGSTGNPKGVVLSHANLLANIRAMQQVLAASPRDVFVSWLPLYHDMGLIGAFLGSLCVGFPLVVMSPLTFLARPERWLWAIHRYRGTLSAAPNFAYELCLKRIAPAALEGLDLSHWRLAFNGAEAVSPDTLRRFTERFTPYGLRPEAVTPVYGLAEASVGLLFPPLGRGPVIDGIRREPLALEHRALPAAEGDQGAQRFVSCGVPLPGHAIRIVDEAGQEVTERIEGRLEFKGPSATRGYFRNSEATAGLFHDGWLDTGDRAYVAAGEVYLTGRVKDMVIRGGRNLYPQEIEDRVAAVEGVRKGGVAVFGSPDPATGTERLVVLAETRLDGGALDRLRQEVVKAVLGVLGEPPDEVVLAPPHTVLKTSSGKVRRAACRNLYQQGGIGKAAPTARFQLLRLGVGSAALWLRRLGGQLARAAFALHAMLMLGLLAPPTWLATLATRSPAFAWRLGGRAARWLLRLTGTPFRVAGLERLPAGPCVLVCNHASYLDGLLLVAALPRPYAFIAKRELGEQFVAGRYLKKLGVEFVERVELRRSVEDANRMAELVKGGRSLLVFPEGTFIARPGLLPFHLGGFLAAAGASVPVVPVTIRGSRWVLPASRWWPRHGALEVEVGAPLPPRQEDEEVFAAAVRLRQAARAWIAQQLATTEQEEE